MKWEVSNKKNMKASENTKKGQTAITNLQNSRSDMVIIGVGASSTHNRINSMYYLNKCNE